MNDSFEEVGSSKGWNHRETCCDFSLRTSDSIARKGRHSLRFELNSGDPYVSGSSRSELVYKTENSPNVERWYKFSIFLPNSYNIDPITEILAQWHSSPDKRLKIKNRSPSVSLRTENGDWKVMIRWSNEQGNGNTPFGMKAINLGKYQTNTWADFVFHIKFSYKNDGILQIWRNGVQVVNYTGPTYYNDKKGPYLKIGIYKWKWKGWKNRFTARKKRVVFFDDVEVADSSSSYNSITSK